MAILNNESSESIFEKMKVKIRSGASIVNVKPLFSYNSKCLIIASGPNIKVYNAQSCECLYTLRYHKTNVVSLQENKSNCLQFYSCSQDGDIVRWEIVEGTLLKVYTLKCPVINFYAPKEGENWFITRYIPDPNEYRLYFVNPNKKMKNGFFVQKILSPVLPSHNSVSFGMQGKFVASVYDNYLQILQLDSKKYVKHMCGTIKLLCVTCHPTDLSVATGDDKGRIQIWSNLWDSTNPIRSVYHWHTLPLSDLAFTAEGSHLYSGGGEAVLVKWNLFSEEKNFLPRLGAPIIWIRDSPDSSVLVNSYEDNSLQLIDPHRNIVGLIQGLTRGHFQGDSKQEILSTGLLYDIQSRSIVLNGKPGHLQFYNVFDDKHLFNLDISAKNFITQERDMMSCNVDVSKAVIDDKGRWLATVEYWCNSEVSPMIWLKFWEYNVDSQKFIMNTNIYLPHNKKVNCILFRPYKSEEDPPVVVTTSDDCHFKIWTLFEDDRFGGKLSWNCVAQDYYREHLATRDASYSEDGSVVAIAVANIATIWTYDNYTQLEAALFQEKNELDIKQLKFGKHSCSHLLVCHDGSAIYVWNLLSLSIHFVVHVSVQTIAVDITSDLLAVFTNDDKKSYHNLYLFKPSSPEPIFFKENVSESPILSALFVPSSTKNINTEESPTTEKAQLFFFNKDQCLLTLTDECDDSLDSNINKIKMSTKLPLTPFGFLQAEQKISNINEVESQYIPIKHKDDIKDSMEYAHPTYMDHFAICSKVLRSFLRPKPPEDFASNEKSNENKTSSEDIRNEFESMQIDSEKSSKKIENQGCVTDFSFIHKYVNLPTS